MVKQHPGFQSCLSQKPATCAFAAIKNPFSLKTPPESVPTALPTPCHAKHPPCCVGNGQRDTGCPIGYTNSVMYGDQPTTCCMGSGFPGSERCVIAQVNSTAPGSLLAQHLLALEGRMHCMKEQGGPRIAFHGHT